MNRLMACLSDPPPQTHLGTVPLLRYKRWQFGNSRMRHPNTVHLLSSPIRTPDYRSRTPRKAGLPRSLPTTHSHLFSDRSPFLLWSTSPVPPLATHTPLIRVHFPSRTTVRPHAHASAAISTTIPKRMERRRTVPPRLLDLVKLQDCVKWIE